MKAPLIPPPHSYPQMRGVVVIWLQAQRGIRRGAGPPNCGGLPIPRDTYDFIGFGEHASQNLKDSYGFGRHDRQTLRIQRYPYRWGYLQEFGDLAPLGVAKFEPLLRHQNRRCQKHALSRDRGSLDGLS